MTEQPQEFKLPTNEELTGVAFGDEYNPKLAEKETEARAAGYDGDMREVKSTDPDSQLNLEEEPTSGPMWTQIEAERRLLEQRQHQANLSQQERYVSIIDKMTNQEMALYIANTTIALSNYRTMKAD